MIGPTLLNYILCASFFNSFKASDGSEGTTTGRVLSSRSIMVYHSFRSKEVLTEQLKIVKKKCSDSKGIKD